MLSGFLTGSIRSHPSGYSPQQLVHIVVIFYVEKKNDSSAGTNPANNTTCDAYLKTNIQQLLIRYILIS